MHIDRFVQMGTTIPYTQRKKKPMWLKKAKSRELANRSYIVCLDWNCIILFTVHSNGIEKNQSMRFIKPVKGSDIENWMIKVNIQNETRKKKSIHHIIRDTKHEVNEHKTKQKNQKVKHQPKPKPWKEKKKEERIKMHEICASVESLYPNIVSMIDDILSALISIDSNYFLTKIEGFLNGKRLPIAINMHIKRINRITISTSTTTAMHLKAFSFAF